MCTQHIWPAVKYTVPYVFMSVSYDLKLAITPQLTASSTEVMTTFHVFSYTNSTNMQLDTQQVFNKYWMADCLRKVEVEAGFHSGNTYFFFFQVMYFLF